MFCSLVPDSMAFKLPNFLRFDSILESWVVVGLTLHDSKVYRYAFKIIRFFILKVYESLMLKNAYYIRI